MNCFNLIDRTKGRHIWLSGVENDGLFVDWYKDCQLHTKCYWKSGKRDGNYMVYHDTGQISIIGIYDNESLKDYIQYDIDGNRVE